MASAEPNVENAGGTSRFELGGVVLTDCAPEHALRLIRDATERREPLAVHMCNAYTITLAARDPEYRAALNQRSLNLIDGTPVTWHFRLLSGRSARGPVRGPSFMRRLLDEPGIRHFLYGGTDQVLTALRQEIARSHPQALVCGSVAPPFRPTTAQDVAELAQKLLEVEADIVWVGLGTPKQDDLLARLVSEQACVAIGVGAAFDFLSGQKREAPALLQNTGLEWAYRLLAEPRRLWKRYLVGNTRFIVLSTRALWSSRATRRRATSQ